MPLLIMLLYTRLWMALTLVLCALSSTICAQNGDVHAYHLSNGLKLVVKEDHRAPVFVSQIWYRVGSSNEHGGITGISHVLEHMMFRGTHQFGPGQFSKIIAQHGGQENAFTTHDHTAYYEKMPVSALGINFELEADRMQHLLLDPKAYQKELQVVMEERRMRVDDNPQQKTMERFLASAYVSSPYHHPVIGWMDDLKHMTLNDLVSWYHQWYAPNNAVIVVVGDVHPKAVYDQVNQYFGSIPKQPKVAEKPQKEVVPLGARSVVVQDKSTMPFLIVGYPVPTLLQAKQEGEPYALAVITALLSSGRSSLLETELIRHQHVAAYADAFYDIYQKNEGLLVITAVPAQGKSIQELTVALNQIIEHLKQTAVNPSTLKKIVNQVKAEHIYKQDDLDGQATEIGAAESVGLSWKDVRDTVARIQSVTPKQIQDAAQKYLIPNHQVMGVLNPS